MILNILLRIFHPNIDYLERHGWRKTRSDRWSNGAVALSERQAVKYQRTVNRMKETA